MKLSISFKSYLQICISNAILCCSLLHGDESHVKLKVKRFQSVERLSVRSHLQPPCLWLSFLSPHFTIKKKLPWKDPVGGKKCKGMARDVKIYWIDHELRAVFFHPKSTFVALMAPRRDLCVMQLLCEDFYIIKAHLKIWDESTSVPFDVMPQPWVLICVKSLVDIAMRGKKCNENMKLWDYRFWLRINITAN